MVKKLAIISTHPIQYYAPVFKLLTKEITLKVFYTRGENEASQFDNGFRKEIAWDVPLLIGYDYTFVDNIATNPGTHHFNGIVNPTLITEIEAYHADAILVYGWASKSHFKAIRYFSGKIPVYFRGDSTLINKPKGIKNLLKTIFLRFVYRHVDFAFYVGQQNKAYFKKYGLKEKQLIFAPHAIDNDRFSDNRMIEGDALRVKLGIAKEDILILFGGKLEAKKNPMLLLDAFIEMGKQSDVRSLNSEDKKLEVGSLKSEDRVVKENALRQAQGDSITMNNERGATNNEQHTTINKQQTTSNKQQTTSKERLTTNNEQRANINIHLLYVGNGELEESLKMRIERLGASGEGLKENESEVRSHKSEEQVFSERESYNENPNLKSNYIHFMNFQNQTEMPVVYQACDLFCLPSKSETWGLAVNESMACGKAILVSDKVGCAVDLVQDNINGAIFESENLYDLTEKLEDLCQDRDRLNSLGQESKKIIQNWSLQKQVEAIVSNIRKK